MPIVLCRDEEKEGAKINFDKAEISARNADGSYVIEKTLPFGDEYYRCKLKTANGNDIILSDYATCGKKWADELSRISVWLNIV